MAVKVIRLDYPIGAKVQLPDYIRNSNRIVGLENFENNLYFWACFALAEGCTKTDILLKPKNCLANFL